MRIDHIDDQRPFVTKDGSTIREFAGLAIGTAKNQSLAEATVPPGGETDEHHHVTAEEIYFFTGGAGRMRLGGTERDVEAGHVVVIPPGTPHKLWNTGTEPLVLLCCCAPAYTHEDTVMS